MSRAPVAPACVATACTAAIRADRRWFGPRPRAVRASIYSIPRNFPIDGASGPIMLYHPAVAPDRASGYDRAVMSSDPYLAMLEAATELCLRAEPLIAAGRAGGGEASFKADESVVTPTDHAVQRMILAEIATRFPGHAVAAEESLAHPTAHADRRTARFCWAVDPLDGTRNFVAGLPCYSTSIAVLEEGRPVVAAVYDHNIHWLFAARRGGGATLNGRRIVLAGVPGPGDRLVALSSSKSRFTVAVARAWSAEEGLVLRNLGSTALHLALVASGGLDAALCTKCKIWDIAAGALLVTEAGGMVTTPEGGDPFPFLPDQPLTGDLPVLAGGPAIHTRLLAGLRDLA